MSAPDFYFAVNATFRHLHDRYGKGALVRYWRALAHEYYGARIAAWKTGGLAAVAEDWREYFSREPQAEVEIVAGPGRVDLMVHVCPAIKHLCDHGRSIVPYFCEHCDHTCGVMAEEAGLEYRRTGGMGSCRQEFVEAGAVEQEAREC